MSNSKRRIPTPKRVPASNKLKSLKSVSKSANGNATIAATSRRYKSKQAESVPTDQRVNRVLTLENIVEQSKVAKVYVKQLQGYIYYRQDIPAGWIWNVTNPEITIREQLYYSLKIVQHCMVTGPENIPMFDDVTINSLSEIKIMAIVNAIINVEDEPEEVLPSEDEDEAETEVDISDSGEVTPKNE